MSHIGNRGTSKRINTLTHKRNMKVHDYLHKSSKIVIDYALKHNISTIVIGDNAKWKQNINIGKKNNQNFVSIPHAKLIQQLQYKGEEVGIKIITTEESYTSKTDNFANEPLKKFQKKDDGIPKPTMGKRVSRGMFKSSTKRMINADVNGALGILRKVVPESRVTVLLGNRGVAITPNKFNAY